MATTSGRLLSDSNPNIEKMRDELRITSAILHLAPGRLSGHQMCPMMGACEWPCLNMSGHGASSINQAIRIEKTKAFFEDRAWFMTQLAREIATLAAKAERDGHECAVRLNGTSDWRWELEPVTFRGRHFPNLMTMFPLVHFYDYTKVPNRRNLPANYHLTFSLDADNDVYALQALARGQNVAVVFRREADMPLWFSGYRVINGDKHDYRYLDASDGPYIIGLVAKGRAIKDRSGFVRDPGDVLDETKSPTLAARTWAEQRRREAVVGEMTEALAAD